MRGWSTESSGRGKSYQEPPTCCGGEVAPRFAERCPVAGGEPVARQRLSETPGSRFAGSGQWRAKCLSHSLNWGTSGRQPIGPSAAWRVSPCAAMRSETSARTALFVHQASHFVMRVIGWSREPYFVDRCIDAWVIPTPSAAHFAPAIGSCETRVAVAHGRRICGPGYPRAAPCGGFQLNAATGLRSKKSPRPQ
jgi:hypothetical protein